MNDFHAEHNRVYGHSVPGEPVETVNLRLTALGNIVKPPLLARDTAMHALQAAQLGSRPVYFGEADGFVDCPVYDRYRLGAGMEVTGPAIVEEYDSTTVIHPGYYASVDQYGTLLLTKHAIDSRNGGATRDGGTDTHKAFEHLRAAGYSKEMAEALLDTLGNSQDTLATKADFMNCTNDQSRLE